MIAFGLFGPRDQGAKRSGRNLERKISEPSQAIPNSKFCRSNPLLPTLLVPTHFRQVTTKPQLHYSEVAETMLESELLGGCKHVKYHQFKGLGSFTKLKFHNAKYN